MIRRLLLAAACLGSLVVPVVLTSGVAHAETLGQTPVTQTAARNYGNGGPALNALVHAGSQTVASDGAVVFFDTNSHQLRRVDPGSGVITVLAGTGPAVPAGTRVCSLTTTVPATSVYLDNLAQIFADGAGDIFALTGLSFTCPGASNVYRLDPNDGMWHLAVAQRLAPSGPVFPTYVAAAVDAAGTVYVSDSFHHVIRAYPMGSDPTAVGPVVAGTVDVSGTSGDGGAATSATIDDPDILAAGSDGTLYMSSGLSYAIRRVAAATGLIDTVAGVGGNGTRAADGTPAAAASIAVRAISVGPDGTVYFNDFAGGSDSDRAFTPGGALRTVVDAAHLYAQGLCAGATIAAADAAHLLVSCNGPVRSWTADGSMAESAGAILAGVSDTSHYSSPDGATLSSAFLDVVSIAQAPDGTIALATPGGLRSLSGLAASSTLKTLSSSPSSWVAYGDDGTAYSLTGTGTDVDPVKILAIAPGGATSVVAGGGANDLADGIAATSVALPVLSSAALDAGRSTIYFDSRTTDHVWALDLATGLLHVFAGASGPATFAEGQPAVDAPLNGFDTHDLAVDQASHAVYLGYANVANRIGLERIDIDGTIHALGCAATCSYGGMTVATDGTIYTSSTSGATALHPNGVTATALAGLVGPVTVLHDGTLLGLPVSTSAAAGSGGLLAMATPADDTFPGPAATVTATPLPAAISVSVTPPAVTGDVVTVVAAEEPTAPRYPAALGVTLATFTTDGTTAAHAFTFHRLAPSGSSGAGLLGGHTYRISVFTTTSSTPVAGAQQVTVSSPAAVADVTPTVDTTPPGAPTLSLDSTPQSVSWTVGFPGDADLDSVSVRFFNGSSVPATPPSDGLGADYPIGSSYLPGQSVTTQGPTGLDPSQLYTVAAWARDTSGNYTAPVTATRWPGQLVDGSPVVGLGYEALGNNTSAVMWTGGAVNVVRYASGATAPATPGDGQPAGLLDGTMGQFVIVPAQPGASVSVSLFTFPPGSGGTYQRSNLFVLGGATTDVVTVSGPTRVAAGAKPTLTGTFRRRVPQGTVALPGSVNSTLYRRAAGTTTWTRVLSQDLSAAGTVTYVAPAQSAAMDYEILVQAEAMIAGRRTVTVPSAVTASLSRSTVRHGTATYVSGVFSPHARVTLKLQRYTSGAWHTLASVLTTSTGSYRLRYVPPKRGTYLLRMAYPASTKWLASASVSRRLVAS